MQGRNDAGGPWADHYASLAHLESLPPKSREFQTLADALDTTMRERERAASKAKNNVEKFRAKTIRFHLQRLRGLPTSQASEPDVVLDWLPHEAWYATRALKPGTYRVATAIAALDETARLAPERAAWAFRVFEEERLQLDFDQAERLAVALYRRNPDADSVERLARVHTWRDNGDAARNLLSEALEAAPDGAYAARSYLARARAASASADDRQALADYGAALALGSAEAALDLANGALVERDLEKARFLADFVLGEAPLQEEALVQEGRSWLPAHGSSTPDGGAHGPHEKGTLGDEKPARRNPVPSGN